MYVRHTPLEYEVSAAFAATSVKAFVKTSTLNGCVQSQIGELAVAALSAPRNGPQYLLLIGTPEAP
jgi:hypothetical protein